MQSSFASVSESFEMPPQLLVLIAIQTIKYPLLKAVVPWIVFASDKKMNNDRLVTPKLSKLLMQNNKSTCAWPKARPMMVY